MSKREIRNVWKHNLEEEMERISRYITSYPYVSMDTEFPGVIAKPLGIFSSTAVYIYHQIRCNVNLLSLIQLGISLSNGDGEMPEPCTWQFNFYFNREKSMSAQESMHLLDEARIDFERLKKDGIPLEIFADLFTASGLLVNPCIKWISFHSSYDFGYLIRAVTGNDLPGAVEEFSSLLISMFPEFYDIKYLINSMGMKGGLQDLADDLKIERTGIQHQAGSDSLLTLQVFHTFKKIYANDLEKNAKYRCKLFGIDGER